jgi:phage terminase large subunit-like protein
MTKCKYIDDYIADIESGRIPASVEMHQACELIKRKLSVPDVFIDVEKAEKAVELIERYFEMKLFPWELFIISLIHCYYRSTDTLVFSEFLIMMGRGNGKNGFISGLTWYLTTKNHGIKGYNVEIIANSEKQAKTSFNDIYEMLDNTWGRSKKFFYKTKEIITNLNTKSYVQYNTSNAKTKDGTRSACLVFDEIHEYQSDDTIKVFRSSFGKRKHSRIFYITTNGYVRDGVLDEKLRIARDVLNGEIKESEMLPLIYKLDNEEEAADKNMWVKANPSLPYLPTLQKEIEKNWVEKDYDQSVLLDLYTKRFNLPRSNMEIAVTDYSNIAATNRPLPDMRGWSCTVGIDYAELSDWAAVNFHFKRGNERYDINHAWICRDSNTLSRVKAPWREWVKDGHATFVEDVSINPDLIADYIATMGRMYNIKMLAMDNFRWALLAESLRRIGFDANDKKRVKLVKPSDIMQTDPVIQDCFSRQLFTWGDNPCLRWATNNTKRVRSSRNVGADTGNFYYAKIEAKSRKTDPFMSLVASMTCESVLNSGAVKMPPIGAITL